MTIVERTSRAARVAIVVALLLVAGGTAPVLAASAVKLEIHPLVGGRYEVGGWLAVSVTLVNPGAATDGYLSVPTSAGLARRHVEMPAGARKVVTLYVEPDAFQREVTVTYNEPGGSVSAGAEIRVLDQSSQEVAIVGDPTGMLRPQLIASGEGLRPEPLSLAAADLPERPEPLRGIGTIIWAADGTLLTDAQRASLQRWVADGGRLVIVGGADWQSRTAGLAELLPLTDLAASDRRSLDALAAFAGMPAGSLEPATVSTGNRRDDARTVIATDDGEALVSLRPFGTGRVILVGADLATPAFRGWEASPRIWDRLAPNGMGLEAFFGGAPIPEETLNAMSGALSSLPALELPPAEVLLALIVGYILLIGPVSYAVLRRLDRRELAWITAPVLIVLFSAGSFGIGRSMKGSDVVANQITVLRTSGTGSALAESYLGIFSPDRSTYSVSVDADALLGALSPSFGFDPKRQQSGSATVDQGRPARLGDLSIGAFGFAGVTASALVEVTPALEVSWSVRDEQLVGTVTNAGSEPISDVAYISHAGGKRIGDLQPGASTEFTLPARNFNGSSASDQVYGFGDFVNDNEAERRTAQRRQVIDALVGYGGWGGFDPTFDFGRGPFVIGWRDIEGPLPVTIDGLNAQRLVTTVEVVSVEPAIMTGQVTVAPNRMSVALIASEGDVSQFDPGSFMLGQGSATFRISLPLEAVGLEPSSLRVIVGPDASILLPGNDMGVFTIPGYSAEVRNASSGEWMPLGDLGLASTFTIDAPGSVMGPSGTLDVRIRSVAANQIGQMNLFVSAEVGGFLAP